MERYVVLSSSFIENKLQVHQSTKKFNFSIIFQWEARVNYPFVPRFYKAFNHFLLWMYSATRHVLVSSGSFILLPAGVFLST